MPQIIAAILIIILVIFAVAAVVWLLQWLVASLIWIFQSILLPALIFLLPGLVALVILAGLLWGCWVAARNYFDSIKTNVNPDGSLKLVVRRGVIVIQSFTLSLFCVVVLLVAGLSLHHLSLIGIDYVKGYYDSIVFPAFAIHFPFWS